MSMYKAASPVDRVGIKAAMEEVELEKLLGKDPVHMKGALAASTLKMVGAEGRCLLERREREGG
jgi:hypothetical protein